mmetsp:Transcript_6050/g.9758  ORF Transcript_6050/g.9758 Transcript_6050/m.9758 type:complete len:176 (-) Transcript_6050:233-760(-)
MTTYCYFVGMALFLITPYADCSKQGHPSAYRFNHKWWILVFMAYSIGHLYRLDIKNWINRQFQGSLSHQATQRTRVLVSVAFELFHLGWQIYGNFIYYEWRGKTVDDDSAFRVCMQEKNNGWEWSVLILLWIGYLCMFIYFLFCALIGFIIYTRFRQRDVRQQEKSRILQHLPRT